MELHVMFMRANYCKQGLAPIFDHDFKSTFISDTKSFLVRQLIKRWSEDHVIENHV